MKVFRPGASLFPLLAWSAIALSLGIWAEVQAKGRPVFHLLFVASIVLGPLALAAHALRRFLTSVAVNGPQGLVVNGRATIPWRRIRSVERRPGPFRKSMIFQGFADPDSGGDLLDRVGAVAIAVWAVLGLLTLLYFSVLPALAVLSPWHPRVVLTLDDGRRLVYRDLDDDAEFVRQVNLYRTWA